MTAMHDLLHVLTGYDRDRAGELQLAAFSLGIWSIRALRIAIVLGPFAVPPRALPGVLRDLWRAWRRGAASRISRATRLEELLPLPIGEVQARLGVAPEHAAHPAGISRARSVAARSARERSVGPQCLENFSAYDARSQDLPDVAVRNLMPHERAQLFELRVRLEVSGELDAVALGSKRLGSRSRGGRRLRGYQLRVERRLRREKRRRDHFYRSCNRAHGGGQIGLWLAVGEHSLDLVSAEMPCRADQLRTAGRGELGASNPTAVR
jgi:hypothetical protein